MTMPSRTAFSAGQVGARDREAQVGAAVVRDVLHDHVDVDALGGDRLEDRGRDAGRSGTSSRVTFASSVSSATPRISALSSMPAVPSSWALVLVDPGPGLVAQGVPNVDLDAVPSSVLHAPELEDPRAGGRELEHLLVGDVVDLAGLGVRSGVGGEDAVDVGVDLAHVGAEGGGHRDGGGVRAPAAERRDVVVGGQALEPGEDHDVAGVEGLLDPLRADLDDPGLAVLGVGDDPGLRARVGGGLAAAGVDGDREQGHRDALAGREEHVELARFGEGGDVRGLLEEVVGGLAHGRDDGDHVLALLARAHDPIGHGADPIGVADGGSRRISAPRWAWGEGSSGGSVV